MIKRSETLRAGSNLWKEELWYFSLLHEGQPLVEISRDHYAACHYFDRLRNESLAALIIQAI